MKGGDKEKYLYLCQKFGVKLVGRRGLGPAGDALVVAIKWNRAARKEGSTMQKFPSQPLHAQMVSSHKTPHHLHFRHIVSNRSADVGNLFLDRIGLSLEAYSFSLHRCFESYS